VARSRLTGENQERDYSGTPLVEKLGLKAGSRLLLIGAPEGFLESLAPLPEALIVQTETGRNEIDLGVVFCTKTLDLQRGLKLAANTLKEDGGLWVAWPKKASQVSTDIDFSTVQSAGLALGLVDNKSCSVSTVYSALRFVVRREDRATWAAGANARRRTSIAK
jgi:hypothetical protein